MMTLPTSEPQHQSGKVRILGVTPIQRQGAAGFPLSGLPPQVAAWIGILAPAQTPPEIVGRLNQGIKAVMEDPRVRSALIKSGLEPEASLRSPQEFTRFFDAAYDSWGRTVRQAKISLEMKP